MDQGSIMEAWEILSRDQNQERIFAPASEAMSQNIGETRKFPLSDATDTRRASVSALGLAGGGMPRTIDGLLRSPPRLTLP